MISATSKIGGGPNHIFLLGKNLSKQHKVFYAIPKSKYVENSIKDNKLKALYTSERKLSIKEIIDIIKFVKKNDINILHAHGKGASLTARLVNLFTNIPVILTYHGIHLKCHNFLIRFLYILYENVFGRLDKKKVFVSESERVFANSVNIPTFAKDIVIPNGVLDMQIKEYRNKETNIYPKKEFFNVISVCRLVSQKNVLHIGEIANLLPDIKFTIIGHGPLWEEINVLKEEKNIDNLFLLGSKINVYEYLYESDVYLTTSLYEGLPISVLEAMSIGLPVIASNVVGNRDTLIHDESGYFFNLGDIDKAKNHIKFLSENSKKLKNMGEQAFKRQRKLFSLSKMISSYESLYIDI